MDVVRTRNRLMIRVSTPNCHATQEISARRVAAAVERQVQQLGWAAQRNLDVQEGWELTEEYLEHSGINVEGVINQIRGRLDHVRSAAVFWRACCSFFGPYFRVDSTRSEEHKGKRNNPPLSPAA